MYILTVATTELILKVCVVLRKYSKLFSGNAKLLSSPEFCPKQIILCGLHRLTVNLNVSAKRRILERFF